MYGISVFPGLNISWADYVPYLEEAASCGFKLVFTSLHIPEANPKQLREEMKYLSALCRSLDLCLIADVSKNYFSGFNYDDFSFYALRLDFGFSDEEIIELSRHFPGKIQLNASVINEEKLASLEKGGLSFNRLEACHNYYPREDTGISRSLLEQRNRLFHQAGLATMAFCATHYRPRAPLFTGLPTAEQHRFLEPVIAAQDLHALGTDHIIIGDAMASSAQLALFSQLKSDALILLLETDRPLTPDEKALTLQRHTNRYDMADRLVRSQQSIIYQGNRTIRAAHCTERKAYSLCLDNEHYGRYQGELQVACYDRPADRRVNVLGSLLNSALLIDRMTGGEHFTFRKP